MIKTAKELKLKVKVARLLKRQELIDYEENMPVINEGCAWWLADIGVFDDIAYAEGNYSDEDMFCLKDEANTWIRVALEIECDNITAGDEFIYRGYVFTALSSDLAISNNFLGVAKYFDESMLPYIMESDGLDCTIGAYIATLLTDYGDEKPPPIICANEEC